MGNCHALDGTPGGGGDASAPVIMAVLAVTVASVEIRLTTARGSQSSFYNQAWVLILLFTYAIM